MKYQNYSYLGPHTRVEERLSKGIKPIIGMETYVASRKHIDKDAGKDKQNFHLILQLVFH
jgi:DNA polymerase III alpha subunit